MRRTPQRVFCVGFLFLFFAAPTLAQQVSLTILHTNDTHGHLLPFDYPSIASQGSDIAALKTRHDIGGIARRATLVKRLKTEIEAAGSSVWLVDAGDFSEGTLFSTEYHGQADVEAMNAAGYNFSILGNHEFIYSLANLKKLLGLFNYPTLCANVTETATGLPLTQPSLTRQLGPLKIGIFGLVTAEVKDYLAAKDGLSVASEIETARNMVKTLRPEADIVIAITHIGETDDLKIAAAVPEIDVIVGAHSHTRLENGDFVWHSDELKAQSVNGTIIVQDHQRGAELGRLDLLFDKDETGSWHVVRYRARLIPITDEIPEDKTVAAVVDRYWKPVAAKYEQVLGKAEDDFSVSDDDLASYSLVADAVRAGLGVEFDLENIGSVRQPLVKGPITLGDLIGLDPFADTCITFNISGRKLKAILKSHRPAVSGLRYRIERGEVVYAAVGGRRVKDNDVYYGATNSYFAARELKDIKVTDTGKRRFDMLLNYVLAKKSIRPAYDGRRVILGP
jgi:5'-nucleotidase / UDP-sugar diphosphatase